MSKKSKEQQRNLFAEQTAIAVTKRSRSYEGTGEKKESLKQLSIRLRDEAIKEKQEATRTASSIV